MLKRVVVLVYIVLLFKKVCYKFIIGFKESDYFDIS